MASAIGWSVVPLATRDAAANLAETARLLAAVAAGDAGPTLRWYGYVGRAAIIGVGQAGATVADDLAARGVEVVRRLSGGATVLADAGMLALDAFVPTTSPFAGTDVVEAYRWFGEAWAAALVAVGGEAARAGVHVVTVAEARHDRDASRASPPSAGTRARQETCFGTLSPYEVAWRPAGATPRKLVGLSQVRRRGVALFQAGLHWQFDAAVMASLLAGDAGDRDEVATTLARHVADMADAGIGPGAQPDLIAAFEAAAAKALAGSA